ncbi:GtrA family protein [Lacticaseibacillus hulanensis]|uniref:GtrA family protein n=1 Tax=Lacticaseibacillus hulanensis TaxID=2493111 RepID=UPI000FDBC9FA|nr:GtrA family protein [Lacticaseibacillus hulanensis]
MEIFWYVFFGGLATVVNFASYFLAKDVLGQGMAISNTFSWIMSVLFAFVTNKIWVFHSHTEGFIDGILEFGKFVFYRLLSYFIDMGCMLLLIEAMGVGDFLAKLFTQIVVVVANYVFSKLFIFNK